MSTKDSESHPDYFFTFNRLLSTLCVQEFNRIKHELIPVNWKVDQILLEPLEPMYCVWFPETCVASLSVALEQGVTCAAGIVGSDGVAGYEAFLCNDLALSRYVVPVDGRAPPLPFKTAHSTFNSTQVFPDTLLPSGYELKPDTKQY